MPSAEARGHGRRTLARRLAWILALTATAAAAVALGTAMLLADALVFEQVERSARDAAAVLAAELDENPTLIGEIEPEARELGIDMRVAVTRGGRVIAGDATVAVAGDRPCALDEATGELVCRRATADDPAVVVYAAAPAERVYGHRGPFALAAAVVLVVVLLGASLLGVLLARRILAPVERLRQTVIDVNASAPAAVRLPPPSDLEELDALRSALGNLLGRLDAELARTRNFAANAAHELRTPLTKILAELELAAESEAPDVAATLDRLRATSARLAALIERLLLLATPHEALQATSQAASMSALAEALAERRDPQESARLRIDAPDADGLVRGDPVLLAAALDNAVDNALKFSAGPVTVTVREDGAAQRVWVDVDDEGPGVPEAQAAALFEPFTRAPAMSQRPGHGLGLALCSHIARAYGGSVRFVPGRAVGARLRLELPLAPERPSARA
ncbi:MAG: HAMP domain-containing histidine kinase [Myxococcales bacterium]|nr:HAMP domain-containing histidine kinase [Myxococcales bacterium]